MQYYVNIFYILYILCMHNKELERIRLLKSHFLLHIWFKIWSLSNCQRLKYERPIQTQAFQNLNLWQIFSFSDKKHWTIPKASWDRKKNNELPKASWDRRTVSRKIMKPDGKPHLLIHQNKHWASFFTNVAIVTMNWLRID